MISDEEPAAIHHKNTTTSAGTVTAGDAAAPSPNGFPVDLSGPDPPVAGSDSNAVAGSSESVSHSKPKPAASGLEKTKTTTVGNSSGATLPGKIVPIIALGMMLMLNRHVLFFGAGVMMFVFSQVSAQSLSISTMSNQMIPR